MPAHPYRIAFIAAAVVTTVVAAPAASAKLAVPHGAAYSPSALDAESDLPHGVAYSPSAVSPEQPAAPGVRVVRLASNPGFDWGDAAIGAGAALGLMTIGVGGAMLIGTRRRRDHQPAPAA